jgi:hypothetical protein
MEYTEDALLLMKKYAAKCDINWNNLDSTVFQGHVEKRARQLGLQKIIVDIVRWYWLEKHNEVLEKLYVAGKIEEEKKNYCKTSIKNGEVFHRGDFIEKLEGA